MGWAPKELWVDQCNKQRLKALPMAGEQWEKIRMSQGTNKKKDTSMSQNAMLILGNFIYLFGQIRLISSTRPQILLPAEQLTWPTEMNLTV
jgi:hypothetical protein